MTCLTNPPTSLRKSRKSYDCGWTTGMVWNLRGEHPNDMRKMCLNMSRFGKLRLHGTIRVGKDRQSWQELECFLFAEMLICVKEKKGAQPQLAEAGSGRRMTRCTLKGSILIKKHLKQVESAPGLSHAEVLLFLVQRRLIALSDEPVLTLNLSVQELPSFHLQFPSRNQLELWKRALL